MKKLYYFLFCLLFSNVVFGQYDTLVFENFEVDPTLGWTNLPEGNDEIWVRYDEDGLATNGNDPNEQNWFWDAVIRPGDPTNLNAIHSFSFMAELTSHNRNWLILPPIDIVDANAVLHWESAPFQLPRYMDGYKVLVSTGGNYPVDFTDTVFVASEMEAIVGVGESIDLANFDFSEGYFHADMFTDTNYFEVLADSTLAFGILEPHSLSLADYAGERIYIAFLHDSFDDFYFSLDNILVTGTAEPSSVAGFAPADYRFLTYPNPADRQMNVLYNLTEASDVTLQIVDLQGKICKTIAADDRQASGEYQLNVQVGDLASGNYLTVLTVNGNQVAKPFVKR